MANSEDPDQTAPAGAVWSGSALFAYAILSETLVYVYVKSIFLIPPLIWELWVLLSEQTRNFKLKYILKSRYIETKNIGKNQYILYPDNFSYFFMETYFMGTQKHF